MEQTTIKISKTVYPKEMNDLKQQKDICDVDRKKFFTHYNEKLANYLISLKQDNL